MILVDTSVWILTFRRHRPLDLESIVAMDEVVTCLPVIQEVLQGFRDDGAFRIAREAMCALPVLDSPMPPDVVLGAIDMYRAARRAGLTVRSSVDCLIASSALRHGVEVLHADRDFASLARVSALRQRSIV